MQFMYIHGAWPALTYLRRHLKSYVEVNFLPVPMCRHSWQPLVVTELLSAMILEVHYFLLILSVVTHRNASIRHVRPALTSVSLKALWFSRFLFRVSPIKLPNCPSLPGLLGIQSRQNVRDLRCTTAHLKQDIRPSRKLTDVKDVKIYL